MDSRASFAPQESTNQTKKMSRKLPLHTCAVSLLGIANQARTRVQRLHGPLGTIAKLVTTFSTYCTPLIILILFHRIILVYLSFLDHIILAVENVTVRLYPPSSIVFNKIDEVVRVVEILPEKLDEALRRVPSCVDFDDVLDWGLLRVIVMLNFASSTLNSWRISKRRASAREKEIVVDTNFRPSKNHRQKIANGKNVEQIIVDSSSKHDAKCDEANNNQGIKGNNVIPSITTPLVMKGSYKEALTKGKKERSESKKQENYKGGNNGKEAKTEEKKCNKEEVKYDVEGDDGNNTGGNNSDDDGILELFDSAWLMNQSKNFGDSPRSVSFHG